MYQSSTIVGTSLKHIVYVKQVLHFICIPNKPLKTCGGGQPYLWGSQNFMTSMSRSSQAIFVANLLRNLSNIHKGTTLCANW